MRLSITPGWAAGIALLGLALPLSVAAQSSASHDTLGEVTFADDIAPILYEN